MPSRARVGATGRLRSAPARTHPRKDCGHARSLRKDGARYRGLAWHRTRQPVCSCQGRSTTRRSLRPRQEAEAVVAEIRNAGGRADTVGADLAAADGAHTLAKRVRGIISAGCKASSPGLSPGDYPVRRLCRHHPRTREAISSFAASVERFFEFSLRVLSRNRQVPPQIFDVVWRVVSKQSERQLGAFVFLYAASFAEEPHILSNRMTELRNDVIHRGKLPDQKQVLEFGDAAY